MSHRFQIGQEVVCINSKVKATNKTPLVEGKIYKVNATSYCPHCGQQNIQIGLAYHSTEGIRARLHCHVCLTPNEIIHNGELIYFSSVRFAPLEEMTASDEAIAELLQGDLISV